MSDSERLARAVIDSFATGDVEAISPTIAHHYVDHQALGDVEIRGPEGFRQVVRALQRHADVRVGIEDIVAAGDKAADRVRWHYRNDVGRQLLARPRPTSVRGRSPRGAFGGATLVA